MGKFIKFWGAVLFVVFGVEMAPGYFLVPVANVAVVGIAIFASLIIFVMFIILIMLLGDRDRERRYQERREQRTSEEHRETVQVLGALSLRQQMIIDRLLDEGAQVRRISRMGYALVKPDGNYAQLSEEEARYALDQAG